MAMPKPDLPAVPDGPSEDPPPTAPADDKKAKGKGKDPDAASGGRRPYDDVLAELKALTPRVAELRAALTPLSQLPDDPAKPAGTTLYVLNREGKEARITCADIRTARKVLGLY